MKCPNCGADIPDVSRFCLSCGKDVPPPKEIPDGNKEDDSQPSITAMLLIGLAFMMMFFAIIPIVMGYVEGAIAMFAVGAVMVLAAVYVHRLDKKPVEVKKEEKPEKIVKIKCRYCGMLNDPTENRCGSCGATL